MKIDLADRVVVAGGSEGIGEKIACAAARCGAKVGIIRRDKRYMQSAVDSIQADGGDACWEQADVTQTVQVATALDEIRNRYGRIDGLAVKWFDSTHSERTEPLQDKELVMANTTKRPAWQTEDDLSTWERIKKAFANDWEQTKSDFGADDARDMDQDVDDTVKQMAGSDDSFENREQAFRFGYTAQRQYRSDYPTWNKDLDEKLRADYAGDYAKDRRHIRHAYEYHQAD